MKYRIFDLCVLSDLPLPGLPESPESDVDLSVRTSYEEQLEMDGFEWIYQWKSATGSIISACARKERQYLLRFPDLADFHMQSETGSIDVYPKGGVANETLAHLILDQVIPRALGHQGQVIVHASAVELEHGKVVAFLGNSGRGKSTLAASFYQAGAKLLADDCMELFLENGQLHGAPPYPSFRLWSDSVQNLFQNDGDFNPYADYVSKKQMLPTEPQRVLDVPIKISALFLLDDPAKKVVDEVGILPVKGTDAAKAMLEAVFVLDVVGREAISRAFLETMKILQTGVPVYRLNYPREFEKLPTVRRRISDVLSP